MDFNKYSGYQIIDADKLVALKTAGTKDEEVYRQADTVKPILLVSKTNGIVVYCGGVKNAETGAVVIYTMGDFTTPAYTISPDGSVE